MSLGFYFDQSRCTGCRVCQISCKDRMGLEAAGPLPRRVNTFESGAYPEAVLYHLSVGCNHCDSPACVANCPTGAMFKDESGVVLHDDGVCIGCKTCIASCPYGAPQYADDLNLIVKCDSCKALRDGGMNPVCVDACMMRALDFGDTDELKSKYGADLVSELPALGSADVTSPNILVKAHAGALSEDYREVIL